MREKEGKQLRIGLLSNFISIVAQHNVFICLKKYFIETEIVDSSIKRMSKNDILNADKNVIQNDCKRWIFIALQFDKYASK